MESLMSSFIGRFRRSSRRTSRPNSSPLKPERAMAGESPLSTYALNTRAQRARSPGMQKSSTDPRSSGFFNHANNLVVNQPIMFENQVVNQQPTIIERHVIVNNFATGKTVLEHLTPYTNLDAMMDSSARDPPPSCHPGTRLRIGNKLEKWVSSPGRQWNMTWLYGPAGTGKSAVAQTFAEHLSEEGRLGATFFFSRPNDRSDPDCVIPTLAYQLAVNFPEYKSLLTTQLINDPQLLRRSLRVQFRKLIIEPLSTLQLQKHDSIRKPLTIILDGLDECEGEEVQCEFVDMISEAIELKGDIPLMWLICSRPEPHLKYIFSRTDFTINCSREELVIDDESRADVKKYMQDGFSEIKIKFWDVIPPTWPSKEQFADICGAADGLFMFASTAMKYIGDSVYADPMARLDDLLSFLKNPDGTMTSPLEALDLLFKRILSDIPDDVLPMTRRILSCSIYIHKLYTRSLCVQVLSNFLDIDQRTFYRALRKLHSLIDVPTPETASELPLRFYHASFEDYLLDANRSGKFFIEECSARVEIAKSCLSWYKIDLAFFHGSDDIIFNEAHQHGCLPGLKWISPTNSECISNGVARFAERTCWKACSAIPEPDHDLLSRIRDFDFRYTRLHILEWPKFTFWLLKQDPSSGIVRTVPNSEVDFQLVEYMNSMIERATPVSAPTTFPLGKGPREASRQTEYFLVGCGFKAIIFWVSRRGHQNLMTMLNSDDKPSEKQVRFYHQWLSKHG